MLVAQQLPGIKKQKQLSLNNIPSHTLDAEIDLNNFTFKAVPAGPRDIVSRKIKIKTEIKVKVGAQPIDALNFFKNIGCVVGDSIDMLILNQIKQYLDMIKDGTSSKLLKELQIFSFTRNPMIIPNVTYPNTLDAIKEYFNQHYKKEGKLSSVFWPRHGEYSFYLSSDEIGFHDCGFKPKVCILKGPSGYIDALPHGQFQLDTDLVFPKGGGSIIKWTPDMLQTIGYPPGCSITTTNTAPVGQDPVWGIEIVCQNSNGDLKVKINQAGIFKAKSGHLTEQFNIKGVANLEQMTQGNAFKKLIQESAEGKGGITPNMKLILLGLILIKSFGDNSFDITQRELLLYNFLTTIFTCDFTLFLSAITSGMRSSAVLTTNTRLTDNGPTGNLSTRFSPFELSPKEELAAIFESCMFENYQYLRMLVDLYNQEKQKSPVPADITIKAGSELKTVNLWFLATIIKAVQNNMVRHIQIYAQFVSVLPPAGSPIQPVWKDNKEKILQLLKSYCKIVFPFVTKNDIWSVFAQTGLTSNYPVVDVDYVRSFATPCRAHIEANKDSLKVAIDDCLTVFRESTTVVVSIGKINAQQYACLISKHFIDTAKIEAKRLMNAKLPKIPVEQCVMFDPTTMVDLKHTGAAAAAAMTEAMIMFPTSASTGAAAGALPVAGAGADAAGGGGAAPLPAADAAVPAELPAADDAAVPAGDAAGAAAVPAPPPSAVSSKGRSKGRSKIGGVGSPSRSRSRSPIRSSRRSPSRSRSPRRSSRRSPSRNRSSRNRRARSPNPRIRSYRGRPEPQEELSLLDLLKRISEGFDPYINSTEVFDESHENVVFAGFPPKTLSGQLSSSVQGLVNDQIENFKFIVAIMLYAYLSQLMRLINIKITNNIATMIDGGAPQHTDPNITAELNAQLKRCSDITDQLKNLIDKAYKIFTNEKVKQFGTEIDRGYVLYIQKLIHFDQDELLPEVSQVVELVEEIITNVKTKLTSKGINPSMDTIVYAISCLNFDIFYRCLTDSKEYNDFYNKLQVEHRDSQIINIPKLHRDTGSESTRLGDSEHKHSFFLYFYENIHNIAYNVFYNHEYRLPTVCQEFGEMVKHLISETTIQLDEQARNSGEVMPVRNTWSGDSILTNSDDSMPKYSSSEGSTSPITSHKRSRVVVPLGGVGYGGGSSRTRRQRKKQTKRTRRRHNKRSGK